MTPATHAGFESRSHLLLGLSAALAAVIIGQAVRIQLLPQPRLASVAQRQFRTRLLVRPMRGLILDRNGDRLAVNTETYSLAARPTAIDSKQTVAQLLSRSVDLPVSKILPKLQEKREFAWIKRHLSESELARMRKFRLLGADGDLREGLFLVRESERAYPHGSLAAHVLGDVNVDSEGLEGVELWKEQNLKGRVLNVSAVKDALGRPAFLDTAGAKEGSRDGDPVTLTLDAHLQFAVEEELAQAMARTQARAGSALVMNAQTGEIAALANWPTFDPNHRAVAADKKRNRALTDGFEPGSTLKPLLVAGALARGAKLTDSFYGERGTFTVQGKRISEAQAHERFEWITLERMIQVSSNVVAAKLALKLGADAVAETLASFGFGKKSGMGFPGEISGRVPARSQMPPLTVANLGFGQGLLVTPLQVARAYAALANGGWLVEPQLVPLGRPTSVRVLEPAVAQAVTKALVGVTSPNGTGKLAALPGYTVAGKTGTAQVVDPATGTYSKSRYISSFAGYLVGPHPSWVVLAVVDEPKGGYYAAEVAAPLFRGILQSVVQRYQIPPTSSQELAGLLGRVGRAQPGIHDSIRRIQAMPDPKELPKLEAREVSQEGAAVTFRMPELQGLSLREALRVFKGHSLNIEIQGEGDGEIASQIPPAGAPLAEGDTLRLELSP